MSSSFSRMVDSAFYQLNVNKKGLIQIWWWKFRQKVRI